MRYLAATLVLLVGCESPAAPADASDIAALPDPCRLLADGGCIHESPSDRCSPIRGRQVDEARACARDITAGCWQGSSGTSAAGCMARRLPDGGREIVWLRSTSYEEPLRNYGYEECDSLTSEVAVRVSARCSD